MLDFFGPAIIQSTLSPAPDLQAFPAVQLPFKGANIIAFPEVGGLRSTCKRYAPAAQREKMSKYRAWFHERRRPPRA